MFREALTDPKTFCVNWELVPGRGSRERQQEELVRSAGEAARSGRIHGIGLTDNPSGTPALSPEVIGAEIARLGIDPLVHFSCRDKNRNELESILWGMHRNGTENLLVVSGDYPVDAGLGTARPVFDFDPIHLLSLAGRMNGGLRYDNLGKEVTLAPTDFFCGVAVSPFKKDEAELVGQYAKLEKKIGTGARFIVTQIGYDARKLHELLLWLKQGGHDIPVLANIFILTYPAGRAMHAGRIPGCVVTEKLLSLLEAERNAPDKGRAARIERAAGQYAIAVGMGFAGAHIGGHGVDCRTVLEIIDRGQELSRDWERLVSEFDFPQAGGYYLFEPDGSTGLNKAARSPRTQRPSRPPIYYFSRAVHASVFARKSPLFGLVRAAARLVDSSAVLARLVGRLEFVAKALLFECQNCGDCALFDCAYLCPMSQCPKGQRNGPCGGSNGGWCEVYPNEKICVWVRAYRRLGGKKAGRAAAEDLVPPCDWRLWQTSSWLNYFLGRDHLGKKIAGPPPKR
jgi:methylenetetrahydrofolate reductase (NADPH)